MNTLTSVSQLLSFIVILVYIVLDIIIAFYSSTKTIIMNELTYEDKLALIYRKMSRSIQPYLVV